MYYLSHILDFKFPFLEDQNLCNHLRNLAFRSQIFRYALLAFSAFLRYKAEHRHECLSHLQLFYHTAMIRVGQPCRFVRYTVDELDELLATELQLSEVQ